MLTTYSRIRGDAHGASVYPVPSLYPCNGPNHASVMVAMNGSTSTIAADFSKVNLKESPRAIHCKAIKAGTPVPPQSKMATMPYCVAFKMPHSSKVNWCVAGPNKDKSTQKAKRNIFGSPKCHSSKKSSKVPSHQAKTHELTLGTNSINHVSSGELEKMIKDILALTNMERFV